jgi:uncharacterized RDD family membrane protein YckC
MAAWVCETCHSINEVRHARCYHCRAARPDPKIAPDSVVEGTWVSPPLEPTFLYTGVILRGVAYVVDALLIVSCLGLLASPPLAEVIDRPTFALVILLGPPLYFVIGWAEFATTVGMRLLRLRVVRASDGEPIGFLRAVLRYVTLFVTALVIPLVLVAIPIVIDSRRRGLHDHVAGSVVVRPSGGRLEYPQPNSWLSAGA